MRYYHFFHHYQWSQTAIVSASMRVYLPGPLDGVLHACDFRCRVHILRHLSNNSILRLMQAQQPAAFFVELGLTEFRHHNTLTPCLGPLTVYENSLQRFDRSTHEPPLYRYPEVMDTIYIDMPSETPQKPSDTPADAQAGAGLILTLHCMRAVQTTHCVRSSHTDMPKH